MVVYADRQCRTLMVTHNVMEGKKRRGGEGRGEERELGGRGEKRELGGRGEERELGGRGEEREVRGRRLRGGGGEVSHLLDISF